MKARVVARSSWAAMAVVVVVALFVGVAGEREPRTEAERVRAIASGVRCPTCRGLSAAESDALAAQAVRDAIRGQLREGKSEPAIRAFLVTRYGDDILLKPKATGLSGVVWVLPVAAMLVALVGLFAAFRRWRSTGSRAGSPSADDRALVEEALHR